MVFFPSSIYFQLSYEPFHEYYYHLEAETTLLEDKDLRSVSSKSGGMRVKSVFF